MTGQVFIEHEQCKFARICSTAHKCVITDRLVSQEQCEVPAPGQHPKYERLLWGQQPPGRHALQPDKSVDPDIRSSGYRVSDCEESKVYVQGLKTNGCTIKRGFRKVLKYPTQVLDQGLPVDPDPLT